MNGSTAASRARSVFRWPLVIGAASLVGLLSALMGDGLFDVLSWLTLAIPLAVSAFAMTRREPRDP